MQEFDLVVIGGGINGAGVARDASGRGLSVLLVKKMISHKLLPHHLQRIIWSRYPNFSFGLVRESSENKKF